ncbi:MAG TPA: ECF transporter S component [Clostridia bacterium]|nr:ECF transporter S component [Clostridia bacterium]
MERSITNKKFGTRQIAVIGMLSAISVVLGATGFGFVPLPMAKATIMQIPVVIGAILEGPIVGVTVGLIFGVFSIIQNFTNPTILSFALVNPLVSVLPRMLIGVTAYYSYKIPFIKNDIVKTGIGAAIGSLTNTAGVLGMIYLLYASQYAAAKNIPVGTAAKTIFVVALTNGLPEVVVCVLITIPVVLAVRKIMKK